METRKKGQALTLFSDLGKFWEIVTCQGPRRRGHETRRLVSSDNYFPEIQLSPNILLTCVGFIVRRSFGDIIAYVSSMCVV